MSATATSHSQRLLRTAGLALLLAAASVLVIAPAASAGKAPSRGGGGKPSAGTSTIALVVVDSADGLPHWNGQVRFDVTSTATSEPHVEVVCTQGGETVYVAQTGYFDSYPWPWTQTFTLASGAWDGGAADCNAKLFWFNGSKTVVGAQLPFHVYA